jgi:hypothetical protein
MYVTVQEVIDECGEGSPERIKDAILLAQQYIEKVTGQWFETRELTMLIDGRGQTTEFLPVFAYSISSIKESDVELDTDEFYVYNRYFPDDRKNPKIVFTSALSIGRQNLSITGMFGYVESDKTTPILIKKVCKKLALTEIGLLSDGDRRDAIDRGRIIEETTDGHSYTLASVASTGGATGDAEIDQVLMMYKAPIWIGKV